VLIHELVGSLQRQEAELPARGGIAPWQQRILVDYIEEHLADNISLATLGELVRLSRYHLCRVFRQSIGLPPHRYHMSRRIERAKGLLSNPEVSVTEVAVRLGFSATGAFTTAFRKATGSTPTAYRRSLDIGPLGSGSG
jgi:AraC family transcriptional regulator